MGDAARLISLGRIEEAVAEKKILRTALAVL
jgi:hypothetical protein